MSFKEELQKKFSGLQITDADISGHWGPLYVVQFKSASNVISKDEIEEWCLDTIRSENWIYDKQK